MTARDFTPTDEQLSALGLDLMGLQEAAGDRAIYWLALPLTESPAFQSIIAAAKAEARAEIVEELEAIDLIVPSETSEHEWGIDEATRAIIKLIRSKDEEASA